ncbi:MAG: hypothetical protein IM550_20355 [Microcystis sp. M54BS1]|nr:MULTISPECIES: hypothetical protein [unclassified Microcystis]MCA2541480.1 hypothetical protein [Microcystis sp. M54BS1]MCA2546920.1 hypothetical protein [Microcystis sp. M55BS1]MCA2573675.1 hypothetical protein [Microcystis sp. M42BS1]MCA2583467.1 hypothetical protein [Microcystis sp. M39BS1]MCA2594928.1 hypothetical protein [Microcystis sp. M38BS1]
MMEKEKEMGTIKISDEFRAKLQAWVDEVAPKILANKKEMGTIKISDEFRAKLQAWVDEVAPKILANKKESPAQNLPSKKEFNQCEAQHLQEGDRVKFGRYLNSKTWVVQGVRKQDYHPISPCVQSVIVTCRDPRKKSIQQFSLPAKRLIIREGKV